MYLYTLNEADFPKTWTQLRRGLDGEVAPGFVLGFWLFSDPDRAGVAHLGARRIIPSTQPLFQETVFDLASLTKVISTATLTGVLVDRGWLNWEDPVRKFFPHYPYPAIRVRHLLAHTGGLVWWAPFWRMLKEYFHPISLDQISIEDRQHELRKRVFATPPENLPDQVAVYSDLSFLILGFILEEVFQMSLDRAVEGNVWSPMHLKCFYRRVNCPVDEGRLLDVAATEDCSWRGGVLQGQVHDDNTWAAGGFAGHAGAFGTIRDLLLFSREMVGGFLSRATLESMWSRVSIPTGCERTLGWDTRSRENSSTGELFSMHSIGHLGFTGGSLWIDLDQGIAVSLLSNRVHPSRENNQIKLFRPLIHTALMEDLKDQGVL